MIKQIIAHIGRAELTLTRCWHEVEDKRIIRQQILPNGKYITTLTLKDSKLNESFSTNLEAHDLDSLYEAFRTMAGK